MNNVFEFPRDGQHYDEASVWIAKLDNELSAADQVALKDWMAADEKNLQVLLQMAKLWDQFSVMSRLSQLFPEPPKRVAKTVGYPLAVAATVALVAVLSVMAISSRTPTGPYSTDQQYAAGTEPGQYETAVGEQSTVSLPDGSEVVLNTNSLVKVEYTDNYRLIRLKRGEIHVSVAPDKSRPLSVISDDKIVQAVGTRFSLQRNAGRQLELIVIEGKVLAGIIDHSKLDSTDAPQFIVRQESFAVAAGQEVVLGSEADEVRPVSREEIDIRLSWRNGNLIFRGEALEDALKEIARYTSVEFEILDDDLKRVQIAGRFRAGDVEGLLAALRANFKISHQRIGGGKILLSHLMDS